MSRQVALLRGVNVGAHRRVAMSDLRALAEGLGCEDVATHLRSGNLVYAAPHPPARMADRLARALADALGFGVEVVVRAADAMRAVVTANPFTEEAGRDPGRLQVVFLSAAPPGGALTGIESEDLGDDRIHVARREVYVWCPGGVTGSRALGALERRRLPVVATARNWRTVTRLHAMLGG